ncbi:hypothetical protein [Acanthamoeba polyphaga mimivirus]|uniref:Uncharacterized protein n=1 Tax=Acanthamoeba polyphaga mimivirus TaxID=212035 RepID=A0A2L2DL09_MIMIV|nr:hypothetical protein [Acanthamoeba polyphaga mimivirus]
MSTESEFDKVQKKLIENRTESINLINFMEDAISDLMTEIELCTKEGIVDEKSRNLLENYKKYGNDVFLEPIPHLMFDRHWEVATPKEAFDNANIEALDNSYKDMSVDAIIESLIYTETSCKKCQKPFVKGRCVVKKVGITCGHCGHHCKHGKLQETTKKTSTISRI